MLESDEQIVVKVRESDKEAFSEIIRRYEAKLTHYLRKFIRDNDELEDVLQDVFIKAYVHLQDFDVSLSFSSWVYRIAHNELVNTLKKRKHISIPIFEFDILFPTFIKDTRTMEAHEQQSLRVMLDQCLDKLPIQYKEILVLYFFEEFEYKEIADILHIPISTVGVRLFRAKKRLAEVYKKNIHI